MVNELTQFRREVEWLEPLAAYLRLRHRGALLLDGLGAHPEARFAYVALSPRLEARLTGGHLNIREGERSQSRHGDPLSLLQELVDRWRFDAAPGFTGGFVGYFAYEAARAMEPTLPARPDWSGPDVVFRLCRDVLVLDRLDRTAVLWTTDLPGEADAARRAEDIVTELGEQMAFPAAPDGAEVAWAPSLDEAAFASEVHTLRDHIRNGDLFQANLATRFRAKLDADPVALFAAMQEHNPSPFMALMEWGDHAIVSNSPEQLFAVCEGIVRARPIAGTRPRGSTDDQDRALEQELLTDPKEQAEHTMLVDLVRNDIARVAVPGTVQVAERMSVERYRHVMHLVSRVEGRLRPDARFTDWMAALFPGGTITGAPKHRACLRIHETEPVPRGPYTGSAGFLSWDHRLSHWNILIRTLVLRDGVADVHAGSGIVMDSEPGREWAEAGHKARSLLEAATGLGRASGNPTRLGEVSRHGAWRPDPPPRQVAARVLLIDNYDSFVWNLADYCAALGADVKVVRNDEDWAAAVADFAPTHIILSPGPGWPADAGCTLDVARRMAGKVPILGVCLGHQALAEAFGGRVQLGREAVHGKVDRVLHDGTGLLAGSPSPLEATRYHSLVVDPDSLPPEWSVTATLRDGTIMAMRHRRLALWGVQFHPESLCTHQGLEIVLRFLETTVEPT